MLDFVRCIEYVWSAYEVMGEIMMKIGAMKPVMKDTTPILKRAPDARKWLERSCNVSIMRPSMLICTRKKRTL